jgi:hypothetical protein
MQPMDESQLKQIIDDAQKQGKDVSKLKAELEAMSSPAAMAAAPTPTRPMGQIKKTKTEGGEIVIQSTGPAREEDFE